jgi:L-malate glycosyltransferase
MVSGRPKRTILHITPHMGGGVGRVLINYLEHTIEDPDFSHELISLEYANEKALTASRTIGFSLRDTMARDPYAVLTAIAAADAVVVHWWNHPLLYDLLVRHELPASRIAFWSHISGLHAPYVIPEAALMYPDRFVCVTPISLEVPEISALPEERKKTVRVIWSAGGIESFLSLQPVLHKGFTIGYIGTVDYCKMHPSFLSMCDRVAVPEARFVVCGGPSEKRIEQESRRFPHPQRWEFTGKVDDVAPYLASFDVFGYPLAPYHYGSGEQALLEAMAIGVPPVVMANPTERLIVKDGITGIIAADEKSWVMGIEQLHADPDLRNRMSVQAREQVKRNFSTETMIRQWTAVYEELLGLPKTPRAWSGKNHGTTVSAAQLFIESIGSHGQPFQGSLFATTEKEIALHEEQIRQLGRSSPLWLSETRGTPRHYFTFFPSDRHLHRWCELLQR